MPRARAAGRDYLLRAGARRDQRARTADLGEHRPGATGDPQLYGYISEYHGFGRTETESGDYAEDLAATMLASTLGIEFDPDAAWNERRKVYETSELIVDTKSITLGRGAPPSTGPASSPPPCSG